MWGSIMPHQLSKGCSNDHGHDGLFLHSNLNSSLKGLADALLKKKILRGYMIVINQLEAEFVIL